MRRFGAALASLAAVAALVALPAWANGGHEGKSGKRGERKDGGDVCRSFELTGTVLGAEGRAVRVGVKRMDAKRLRSGEVTLLVGSRTRAKGEPATGAVVAAAGVVCQVDEADAPVFYTRHVKVKRGAGDVEKRAVVELRGEIVDDGEGWFEVLVERSSGDGAVRGAVKVLVGDGTVVKGGEPGVGAVAVVTGLVSKAGDERVVDAKLVVVEEPADEVDE